MVLETRKTNLPTYEVTLPIFEGPLDLLLYLIEREELDITEVSLAQVTHQYLVYLGIIGERDPDNLADFLVIAAKLLLIKSRALIPQPPPSLQPAYEEEGEDLVQQLIEYRRFKEAAGWLREIEAQGEQSYIRLPAVPLIDRTLDMGDLTLDDLVAAVRRVLLSKPPAPSVNNTVLPITVSVVDQMDLIRRETARKRSVSFLQLIGQAGGRLEVIVTLLALLEMVKQQLVTMRQERMFGDIVITQKETVTPPPTF
jgi:segregation and condensation protein A